MSIFLQKKKMRKRILNRRKTMAATPHFSKKWGRGAKGIPLHFFVKKMKFRV